METTLEESLAVIFGAEPPPVEPVVEPPVIEQPEEPEAPLSADIAELIQQAQQHYDRALQYLKDGDWAGYGGELDALKAVLEQLTELTTGE